MRALTYDVVIGNTVIVNVKTLPEAQDARQFYKGSVIRSNLKDINESPKNVRYTKLQQMYRNRQRG